ncbi:hypothetical protein PENTCL1PPCAC_11197, partial [Pristionchus entomophagus]
SRFPCAGRGFRHLHSPLTHIVNLPRMVRLRSVLAVCLLPLLSLAAPSPFTQHCNSSLHFDCHDSSKPCIPLEWICDGVHDCPNGQDEAHCSYLHDCSSHQLMCRDGECISANYRCDGQSDCTDGSDEKGCDEMEEIMDKTRSARPSPPSSPFLSTVSPRGRSAIPTQCGSREYQCRAGACINIEAKCDGTWDCAHGDDEIDCGEPLSETGLPFTGGIKCRHGEHECADHVACIPDLWKCDGEKDCDDGSDEAHCEITNEEEIYLLIEERKKLWLEGEPTMDLPSAHQFLTSADDILCDEGHFRCNGGKCLNSSLACDGKRDCLLGEDESERCRECDSRMDRKCSHFCTNTPNGHKCSCPRGMVLGSDGWTCEDWDECLHEGQRCSHYCANAHDGYECSCASGYELAKDRHTCNLREKDMDGSVYVSLAGEIRSAPMFSPVHSSQGYETYVSTNHHGTTKHMGMDIEGGRMYAAMEPKSHEGVLASIKYGQVKKLRENVTGINYVAVDWIGRNVLYTVRHPSPAPGIYLCKMNGLYCRRIVEGRVGANKRQIYKGLAVNPLKGLVAWIDGMDGKDHRIMVANMDGSGMRAVVDHKLSYPSGMTFDVIKNEIYFSDVDTKLIEKINLESGRRSTVLYPVNHPYDLAYFDNLIYWTEWGTETLKVASVGVQHSTPHLIHSFLQFPYGIALNHSLVQPTLRSNPCEVVSCPWMCVVVRADELDLSSSLEARCVCPDEYEENGDYDSSVKGSLPCKMRKDVDTTELMSHVSVEAMEEYCKSGEVCMNGGACVEHANTHGRVDRISCKCADGYGGLWCEVSPLPDSDSLDGDQTNDEAQNGESTWNVGTMVILLLLLVVIGGLIYWGSRNTEEISEITRSTIHRVQEARLPERASEVIKNTTRNLGMGPSVAPSSSFSARNGSTAEVTTTIPPPPNMYPPLPNESSATSSSLSTLPSSSSTVNFANPAFEVHNSTASPYSGFDEMNTTEPSYFTIERADGQETFGNNPFGRLP